MKAIKQRIYQVNLTHRSWKKLNRSIKGFQVKYLKVIPQIDLVGLFAIDHSTIYDYYVFKEI